MPPHFHEGGDPKYGWWGHWPSPEPSTRWLREQQALLHQATRLPRDPVALGTRTGHKLVFTGQCFILHMFFFVSASLTKGPPSVKMLHYNKTWWKRCISHFSSFILSRPTATKRRRRRFVSHICMGQHLLWRKEGTFFTRFSSLRL